MPRLHNEMKRSSELLSRKRAVLVMKARGAIARPKRITIRTRVSNSNWPEAQNLHKRKFV